METLLAVGLASALFSFFLYRTKVKIYLAYRRNADDDLLCVDVYLLRKMLLYHMEVPVIRVVERESLPWLETEIETEKGDVETHAKREKVFVRNTMDIYLHHPAKWREIVSEFRYYTRLYNKFMSKVLDGIICEHFSWKTRFGSADAAVTGLLVGVFWAAKHMILSRLTRKMVFIKRPNIRVVPDFKKAGFQAEFECILSIRLGNVINATLSLIQIPRRKGAKGSERTSHQQPDENCHGKH